MARQSQAKNWWLVILLGLNAVLGYTAFYFRYKVDRLEQTTAKSNANAQANRAVQREADNRLEALIKVATTVDGAETPSFESATQAVQALLGTPDIGDRTSRKAGYSDLLDAIGFLENELNEVDARREILVSNIAELDSAYAFAQERYQQQTAESARIKSEKNDESTREVAEYQQILATLTQSIAAVNQEYTDTLDQKRQADLNRGTFTSEREKEIERLRGSLDELTQSEFALAQVQFEKPDGRIVQIFRGGVEAYIDLGEHDGVFPGLFFSVYSKLEGGSPYRFPKAGVEIVQVIDSRRSLVRVYDNDQSLPLVTGDLLYNPVWSPNDPGRVAMVGLFQIDDELQEGGAGAARLEQQNARFEKLVTANGGRIDAKVDLAKVGPNADIDQVMVGTLGPQTDWLVLGKIPTDGEGDPALVSTLVGASAIMSQRARDNGVRIIDYRNFLIFMGHLPVIRRVPEGSEYDFLFPQRRTLKEEPGKRTDDSFGPTPTY